MTELTELTVIPPELKRADLYVGIAEDGVASLQAGFAPHFLAFHACKDEAAAIAADQPKAARALRLKLKAIRVDAEKTRKALKEDSLRRGKAIDGVNSLLEYQLVPVEQAMEEIEKAEERREAERKAALKAVRAAELAPYCATQHYDLGNMAEDAYQFLLTGAKNAKAERERLAAEAEAARIAAEKAAAEAAAKAEAERQAEMARLRAEREAAAKAQAEAEAKAAAEKAAADAKLAQERKEAAEREAKAKAEADAKLAAERAAAEAERQRIAAEAAKAKAEADRLAAIEAARVAAEKAKAEAEAKAAKEAAAAPEREKVKAFAAMLRTLQVPALDTEEGKALAVRIANGLMRLADNCELEAAKL